jgi:hypothetical protein
LYIHKFEAAGLFRFQLNVGLGLFLFLGVTSRGAERCVSIANTVSAFLSGSALSGNLFMPILPKCNINGTATGLPSFRYMTKM